MYYINNLKMLLSLVLISGVVQSWALAQSPPIAPKNSPFEKAFRVELVDYRKDSGISKKTENPLLIEAILKRLRVIGVAGPRTDERAVLQAFEVRLWETREDKVPRIVYYYMEEGDKKASWIMSTKDMDALIKMIPEDESASK